MTTPIEAFTTRGNLNPRLQDLVAHVATAMDQIGARAAFNDFSDLRLPFELHPAHGERSVHYLAFYGPNGAMIGHLCQSQQEQCVSLCLASDYAVDGHEPLGFRFAFAHAQSLDFGPASDCHREITKAASIAAGRDSQSDLSASVAAFLRPRT